MKDLEEIEILKSRILINLQLAKELMAEEKFDLAMDQVQSARSLMEQLELLMN